MSHLVPSRPGTELLRTLAGVLLATLCACGTGSSTPTAATSPTLPVITGPSNVGKSASVLLAEATTLSLQATSYHVKGSVAFSQHVDVFDVSITAQGALGTAGTLGLSSSGVPCCAQSYKVTVVGTREYFQGDAAVISHVVNDTPPTSGYVCMSTAAASDNGFSSYAPSTVMSAVVQASATYTLGPVTSVNGVSVIPIAVTPPGGSDASQIDVAASGPPYVIAVSANEGKVPAALDKSGLVLSYSNYGVSTSITAPQPCGSADS